MFITVINDCSDANAFGRQLTRITSLFKINPIAIGVKNDLEAAGNIIDTLDANEGDTGIILVNVAPRSTDWHLSPENNGNGKNWDNGTPFAYFYFENILVISTIDGYTLSLVKKLNLVSKVNLLSIPKVVKFAKEKELIDRKTADYIQRTQFRSFDFAPRVANWLYKGYEIPSVEIDLNDLPKSPQVVWWIDNFGNCKTTSLPKDITINEYGNVSTKLGEFKYYQNLKDLPDNQEGIIIGSSGIGEQRFLELVVQGKPANQVLNLEVGTIL